MDHLSVKILKLGLALADVGREFHGRVVPRGIGVRKVLSKELRDQEVQTET